MIYWQVPHFLKSLYQERVCGYKLSFCKDMIALLIKNDMNIRARCPFTRKKDLIVSHSSIKYTISTRSTSIIAYIKFAPRRKYQRTKIASLAFAHSR